MGMASQHVMVKESIIQNTFLQEAHVHNINAANGSAKEPYQELK